MSTRDGRDCRLFEAIDGLGGDGEGSLMTDIQRPTSGTSQPVLRVIESQFSQKSTSKNVYRENQPGLDATLRKTRSELEAGEQEEKKKTSKEWSEPAS
jgi:hypothetical protein